MADVLQRVAIVKRCNFSWPSEEKRPRCWRRNDNLLVDYAPAWRTSSLPEASIGSSNSRGRVEVK
jgi:hypothetical protein